MARRSGAGPAPDPSSLRELARQEAGLVRTLPRERSGRVPAWPLVGKATAAERAEWQRLWREPVAILWEEQHVERAVARYVRMSILADSGEKNAAWVKSVIEQERILLLELGSLLKAGYRISSGASFAPAAAAAPVAPAAPARSNVVDIRARWKGGADEDEHAEP